MKMGKDIRYLVVKKKDSKEVTYFEYEKLSGVNIKPKNAKPFQECIKVNRMIVINPTLISKMTEKKMQKLFIGLLKNVTKLYKIALNEDDDEGSTPVFYEVLNQTERFRREILNKNRKHLTEEQAHLFDKKLDILANQAKDRIQLQYIEAYAKQGGKEEKRTRSR